MITFEQVTKRYGERLALDAVSWHMDEGECVVVLGHSGAGKTTLLRLITHEIQPTSGTVVVGTFRGGRLSRGNRALLRRTPPAVRAMVQRVFPVPLRHYGVNYL